MSLRLHSIGTNILGTSFVRFGTPYFAEENDVQKRILALCGIVILVSFGAALGGPTRTLNSSHTLASGEDLSVDVSVGSVTIEAVDSSQVEVEVRAECKRGRNCESLLADVEIVPRQSSGQLRVKVERPNQRGNDDLDLEVFVRVPRGTPVELDLGVGSVEIYGIEEDLRVEVGVGEVDLELDERQMSDIKLDVGVGSARLLGGSSGRERTKKGFLGSTVRWGNGPDRCGCSCWSRRYLDALKLKATEGRHSPLARALAFVSQHPEQGKRGPLGSILKDCIFNKIAAWEAPPTVLKHGFPQPIIFPFVADRSSVSFLTDPAQREVPLSRHFGLRRIPSEPENITTLILAGSGLGIGPLTPWSLSSTGCFREE